MDDQSQKSWKIQNLRSISAFSTLILYFNQLGSMGHYKMTYVTTYQEQVSINAFIWPKIHLDCQIVYENRGTMWWPRDQKPQVCLSGTFEDLFLIFSRRQFVGTPCIDNLMQPLSVIKTEYIYRKHLIWFPIFCTKIIIHCASNDLQHLSFKREFLRVIFHNQLNHH